MPYRNKQLSFSPDGLSDEMDADCPASGQALKTYALLLPLPPHRQERLPRPTQGSAGPQARIMAIGPDLTQCAPLLAISAFNCARVRPTKVLGRPCFLPPAPGLPRSLALQSHFSQERTDQIRSMLSPPPPTLLPSRHVVVQKLQDRAGRVFFQPPLVVSPAPPAPP